jgi:3-deoxy-manno-octulosonate cytidylyltransferase (CMP-KDO synthetase)
VVVATDDQRIFHHVNSFGGYAIMTSSFHRSGTDRCAEVAGMPQFSGFDIVVNVQGDEPFIQPWQFEPAIDFLKKDLSVSIATLAGKIERAEELFSPNTVKIVFDEAHRALYFSRSAIPFVRDAAQEAWLEKAAFYKHIGIYAFRRETLLEVAGQSPGRLEQAESLEQLRWIENGYTIGVALAEGKSFGIDTPEDLQAAIHRFKA